MCKVENLKFNPQNIDKLISEKRKKELPPLETLEKFMKGKTYKGTFVDFGCGVGYFTFPAEKYFETVIGVDIEPKMIDYALKNIHEGSSAKFILSHENSTALPSSIANVVFMSNVFHEVYNPKLVVNELKRLLKEEGELWVLEWSKKEMEEGPPLDHRISRDELIEMIADDEIKFIGDIHISDKFYGAKFTMNEELYLKFYKNEKL
nr:class I SAM-dependent methyltransferase [Acetoanaerobium pronyense]